MLVTGAALKGSLFGTGEATVVVLDKFKPESGNSEFVVGVGGNGPPEMEVALAVKLAPKPELALFLPIFGRVRSEVPEIPVLQVINYFKSPRIYQSSFYRS